MGNWLRLPVSGQTLKELGERVTSVSNDISEMQKDMPEESYSYHRAQCLQTLVCELYGELYYLLHQQPEQKGGD